MGTKALRHWCRTLLLGMLYIPSLSLAQDGTLLNPQLVVAVYDDAGAAPEIVLRAEAQANRVFQEAGFAVEWENPQWTESSGEARVVAEQPTRLHVRIVPRARGLAEDIFGIAFVGEDGRGRQADVFYDRIADLNSREPHDRAVLLGAVIAHELGHLLLGSHSHSLTGIMRGRWDENQVKLTSAGLQGFSAAEAARMRERVASFVKMDATVVSAARMQERDRVDEPWIARP